MKTLKLFSLNRIRILYLIIMPGFIFLLFACTSSELRVSEFEFEYNNNNYVIRSAYCPGNPESCNQIIGDDVMAVDQNQDRIIDKIIMGNYSLAEVQKIYDHCLNLLERQNKLNKIDSPLIGYYVFDGDKEFEIRTLSSNLNTTFNEFKIIEKKGWGESQVINVFVDENSNGILDEIIKGEISLEEAQEFYSKVIERGLSERELVRADSIISVK